MTCPLDTIICGDVLGVLSTIPDGIVQTCVTSPPYWGLRDYGVEGQLGLEPTPEEYVEKMVAVFREVRRVLRDDGTLWLNMGDVYNSSPKGSSVPYPGTDGVFDRRDKRYGNVTKPFATNLKPKDLCGIPWRVAFALQADGWWLRSDIIWHKPNPMPESVTDRPTKAHEYVFLLTKSARYYFDQEAVREKANYPPGMGWNDAPQGSFDDKGPIPGSGQRSFRAIRSHRNIRTVWTIATQPFPEAHFATFPEALVEKCLLAGSAKGDTVLDPFMGSGTVALVAVKHWRNYIGIELNPEYVELANRRLGEVQVRLL